MKTISSIFFAFFLTSLPAVEPQPEKLGMNPQRLAYIDNIVEEGLQRSRMPGCVVLVGRSGGVAFWKAYGYRQLKPSQVAMTPDTVFDLASLTKPIATATSVMQLAETGRLQLSDPVSQYLPEFAAHGKEEITIEQLLTHQSGLIADNSLRDYQDGRREAFRRIDQLKPIVEPGSKFIYSDVGFIVLGRIVEKLSGESLHQYTQRRIFQPLKMTETGFLPAERLRGRAAVTQQREGRWMRGEVHDPRAYKLDGIAGHAGLFSTAEDLAKYSRAMLRENAVLQPRTIERMTRPVRVSSGLRGLGWDKKSLYSSNRGDLFTEKAFGHGGFTGTALWIDPGLDLFVVFLSNRVHPDGKGSVNSLAGRIGTIAAAAIRD